MQQALQQSLKQHFLSLWLEEAVDSESEPGLGWTWREISNIEGKGHIL